MSDVTGIFFVHFPTGRHIVIIAGPEGDAAFCNGEAITLSPEEALYFAEQQKEAQAQ